MDISLETINDSPIHENESEVTSSFTQQVDELTESELKKIEVQKIEGELVIRTLEQTYRESKKSLINAQKKLGEAKKKAESHVEQISQLMQANTAIIEKFNELKNFQIDIILSNVNGFEKNSDSCEIKNADLSNTLQMILDHDDYLERLKKDLRDKKVVVNDSIQTEIEGKKVVFVQQNELLTQLEKENEKVIKLLNHEMSDHNYNQTLTDERTKRIIQLEADEETFQKNISKELDILEQEKLKLQNFCNNNIRVFDDKEVLNSQLQAELLTIEKLMKDKNELLAKLESNREQLAQEVQKRSRVIDSSKQMLNENIKNIHECQEAIDSEIEIVKMRFFKNEENMQIELQSLYAKIQEKKKMDEKFENCQKELTKLRGKKLLKQKELSCVDEELQNKLKDLGNELKKHEQILLDKNKTHSEISSKIKKLQEEKNNVKLKLESLDRDKRDKLRNNLSRLNDNNKAHNSNEIDKKDSDVLNKKVTQMECTPANKFKYSFGFDDSDESEDEKFLKNTSNKLTQMKTPIYKKPEFNYNFNNVDANKQTETDLLTSDRLFEDLLSQASPISQSTTKPKSTSNDTDIFKVPHPYSTPFKKKYTSKYNKK